MNEQQPQKPLQPQRLAEPHPKPPQKGLLLSATPAIESITPPSLSVAGQASDPSAPQADAAEWFATHEKALFRYAHSLVHHQETARDAVQDTFCKLLEQDTREIQNPKAWLYTVCRRRCYDLNAKAKTRASTMQTTAAPGNGGIHAADAKAPDTERPDAQAEQHEEQDRAMACLEGLPELQREAIRLKLQAGLSYKEIADVLDKSVSHVGVLIHEAIKKLRQQMAVDA